VEVKEAKETTIDEKLIQSILWFAHNTRSLGKIKLFKLLYLLDFEHFRQTGRSVTGEEYRAWKMGPVPSGLVQEWDEMRGELAQSIRIEPERVFNHFREKVIPLKPFCPARFALSELALLKQIAAQHQDTQSGRMIDVTHVENGAWFKTWQDGKGQYAVIDYKLALNDERFDENEKTPVNTLDVFEPLDITERLEALGELDDGWLNGMGRAPNRADLLKLEEGFERYYDKGLPLPWLYPTAEGGVQAEWTLGQWDVSLDISMPAFTADYQALHLRTQEQHDEEMSINTETGWRRLNAALRALYMGVA